VTPDDPRHGTYAGRLAHRAENSPVCDPCREAYNAYQREVRARPGQAERERQANAASSRAAWRLIDLYRTEYEHLRAEELTALRRGVR